MLTTERNWAGNLTYQATRLHQPTSMEELRTIVAGAPKLTVLGSRHSFNEIADGAELVSLERMEQAVEIDPAARTVTVSGGMRYGVLAQALEREGWALHNMASLPHISIAGAVATATHGSGDANGNLATAVVGLELVTSEGDVVQVTREDDRFAGMVVGLGALGVVTRLTLTIQPSYLMHQEVFVNLGWDVLLDRFNEVTSSADSVSLFTNLGETVDEVWLKSRVDPDHPAPLRQELFGAPAATRHMHPVPTLDPGNCTEQLGVPGAWLHRLPHFRLDAVPASGDELQTEYMVDRRFAFPALQTLLELAPRLRPHLWTWEFRTVAPDDLWLSTAYGVDTLCLHVSWHSEPEMVARLMPVVEDALDPFAPRPHWGKIFRAPAATLATRYERFDDFRRLATSLDPRGAFRNDFLERHLWG